MLTTAPTLAALAASVNADPLPHQTGAVSRYPETEPHDSGVLAVGDGHQLWWETIGTPDGTPAVHLHGGPGSGSSPGARRSFDPGAYRAVLYDQRGCGRSRPLADGPDAELAHNTTDHLVADLEVLREHLGIERWVVLGISWGVTLGLAYAQRHPERVRAMVLAAVTTGSRPEVEWMTRAMGRIFPVEHEAFVALVPPDERDGNLSAAYARSLRDPDPAVRRRAAAAWCAWEDVHVSLTPGAGPSARFDDPVFAERFARLVTHYWSHDHFLADGELLAGLGRLAAVPAVLIHGRRDVSGPLDTAWRLHQRWPGSELVVLEDAGHGGHGFAEAMAAALDRFADAP